MGIMDIINKVVGAVQSGTQAINNANYTYNNAKDSIKNVKDQLHTSAAPQTNEPVVSAPVQTPVESTVSTLEQAVTPEVPQAPAV